VSLKLLGLGLILYKESAMRCVYRSEQTTNHFRDGKLISSYICSCDDVPQKKCTIEETGEPFACCSNCESRLEQLPSTEMDYSGLGWQYITAARLNTDVLKLLSIVPSDCVGIVGIPRSGMVPAALLAALTQLPLFEFSLHNGLRQLGEGSRTWLAPGKDKVGKYLVVDDSIYSGNAMSLVKASFPFDAIFAVVYATPEFSEYADYYAVELPSPHFFEWNLFNNGMVAGLSMDPRLRGGIAMDLDGVLCFDPPMPDADHGPLFEAYVRWLDAAEPKYLPRFSPIPCIITFRLERWRDRTIKWLRKYDIKWERLIMSTHSSVIERNKSLDIVGHKALNFIDSGCSMMIESDPMQAEIIHQVSQRPVLCPDAGRLYQEHCDFEALSRLDRYQSTLSDNTTASPSPEDAEDQ
jgi:hypothetical protein